MEKGHKMLAAAVDPRWRNGGQEGRLTTDDFLISHFDSAKKDRKRKKAGKPRKIAGREESYHLPACHTRPPLNKENIFSRAFRYINAVITAYASKKM